MTENRVRRRRFAVVLVPLALAALAACGSVAPKAARMDREVMANVGLAASTAPRSGLESIGGTARVDHLVSVTASVENDLAEPAAIESPPERLIVYTGSFAVAVGSVETALREVRDMAEGMGGYVQGLRGDTATLRIPAARFDDAVEHLREMGRVIERYIQAEDVTDEVVDLRLRLRNAMALRDRLVELLARAETVEAALKVETELARVRTEIERIEGRLQVLSKRVAFSTLTVRFVQVALAPTRPQALPFPWLRELGLENLLGLEGVVR